MAGKPLGVEILGMSAASEGRTLLPLGGKLLKALDMISIHPEQEVAGMAKFPLYVEPATRTIVSPQVAALMAFRKLVASPDGTLRIQLEPVVNVGQVEVPCGGRLRLTVSCGNVGRDVSCA